METLRLLLSLAASETSQVREPVSLWEVLALATLATPHHRMKEEPEDGINVGVKNHDYRVEVRGKVDG